MLTSQILYNKLPIYIISSKNIYIRLFAVTGRHSKNVENKKNKLDHMKLKICHRFSAKIFMAAKSGGIDPTVNTNLQHILKDAQAHNVPKDTIERSLKKASESTTDDYSSVTYEIYGHGGIGLIVKSLTDNTNRCVKEIRNIARKQEMKFANEGSVLFSFHEKGILRLENSFDEDILIEEALNNNIDIDIINDPNPCIDEEDDNQEVTPKVIVTQTESLLELQEIYEKKGFTNSKSSIEYIPLERLEISQDDYDKNMIAIQAFQSLDDVDVVYHNMILK